MGRMESATLKIHQQNSALVPLKYLLTVAVLIGKYVTRIRKNSGSYGISTEWIR